MAAHTNVHHKYMGLPSDASQSEVLASQYAAEVSKADNIEDKDYLLSAMEEWADHFRSEGLTVSNKNIAILGKVSTELHAAGKTDILGELALGITDALHSAVRQGSASTQLISRLEAISTSLFTGVDALKQTTESIATLIPRKHLKAARKGKKIPKSISDKVNAEGKTPADGSQDTDRAPMEEEEGGTGIKHSDGDSTTKGQGDQHDHEMTPPHAVAKDNEAIKTEIRTYYSNPSFSQKTEAQQIALADYYIGHILKVNVAALRADGNLHQMLFDMIDKDRVLRICNKAKEQTLTYDDMQDAVEEVAEAISNCSNAYGRYRAEISYDDNAPALNIYPA